MMENLSKNNPIVVVPQENLETLDMKPRVDILEDVRFSKAIPKSIKYFQLGSLKGGGTFNLEYTKSSKKFTQGMARDSMAAIWNREERKQ